MRAELLVLWAAATAALVVPASAGTRGSPYGPDGGYVIAESRHGNGTVTGAVRPARFGYEVRLPGGTWMGCRRSCSETLRVNTVDIWENDGRLVGAGELANECGVLGCLELRWPR